MSTAGLDALPIIDAAVSHALSAGLFEKVNGHEPKSSPATGGLTAGVWVERIDPIARHSGLAATSVRLELSVRLYTSMLSEPQDSIDPNLTAAACILMNLYSGDFTLGGLVSFVDLLGVHGTKLSARAGYLTLDKAHYRVMTITLPAIVSDVWTQEG